MLSKNNMTSRLASAETQAATFDGRQPQPSRRIPRSSFVPPDLTLERTKVVQTRLYFDDQERTRPTVKSEDVDPAV